MISESQNLSLKLVSYTTLFASILFGTIGQLLMKSAMSNPTKEIFTLSFFLPIGFALSIYCIGVVNWILTLRFLKLSVAYPLTSLNYVGIILGSYYFFDEKITLIRIFGIFLVFVGILFVVIPFRHTKRNYIN